MKRLLVLALFLAACNSNTTPVAIGEFAAPSGLAVTSGGDRDLLFIANEGRDGLRALQLCLSDGGTFALPDGGATPDPCPQAENLQFIPAFIRVFPATIETGDRPRRLAGVRLSRPDGSPTGVVLAVGVDAQLRVVDARNLVEAANHTVLDGGTVKPAKVLALQLDSPGVDVAAETLLDAANLEVGEAAGQTATAFVVTISQGTTKAELVELQVGVDAQGAALVPVIIGQCTLDPVVPRKLAVVPGKGDRVYIADGAGDGVVSVTKASIPPPSATPAACTVDRIAAGGRSTRSVSVSPPWVEAVPVIASDGGTTDAGGTPTPHPAGELLIMVLDPKPVTTGGADLDPGGILIARTADKLIAPAPPASVFDRTAGLQPMEPISTPGLPREVTFLRSNPTDGNCPSASCTPLYIGVSNATPTLRFNLLATATSTDGASYFIDVLKRRFVNTTYVATATQAPTFLALPILTFRTSDPNPPTFTFLAPTADHPNTGWLTAGVSRAASWKVVWHGPFPNLETRNGALAASGTGTILLNLGALSLAPWVSDPALRLGPGDTVSFPRYIAPAGAPASCSNLVNDENATPSRFELTIVSMPAPGTVELAPLPSTATVRGFDFSACPAGLGVVATVRAAGTHPWLVYDGTIMRGRAKAGEPFVATERRYDYPLDATSPAPLATDNVSVAFQLGGNDPVQIGNAWSFTVSLADLIPQLVPRDSSVPQGFATSVLGYSSARYPQLVFTSVTGANEVIQADTSVLGSYGIVSYK